MSSAVKSDKKKKVDEVDDSSFDLKTEELLRKNIVHLVEDRLLNQQKQIRHQIEHALAAFDNQLSTTLQEIREKHFYDIEKEFQENRFFFNEKVFRFKESPLTDYFKIENYRTLYNIAVSTLILLMANLMITDYYQFNQLLDMSTLAWCFNHSERVLIPWVMMFVVSLVMIPLVRLIVIKNLRAYIWIPMYSLHIASVMYIGCSVMFQNQFGIGSAMIVQCEMVRMILKNHSYLRTKVLYCTQNHFKHFVPRRNREEGFTEARLTLPDIDLKDPLTELRRFSYFFFSPTLIYRDQYVLAPKRDMQQILFHIVNFLLCIYFGFVLFKTFCKPQIIYFSKNVSLRSFIQVWFQLMLPGTLSIILLFYGLLHSWMNCWAEVMRFPDRTFYLDWWNSREFGQYYRKWNIVVHEWLFYYVYGDIARLSSDRTTKKMMSFATFLISAVIHEVIISFVLGFFYPILFIIFSGPGVLFVQKKLSQKSQFTNILFWLQMYLGTALIFTLYLTEYYARFKVDASVIEPHWGILTFMIPRTFYL